MGQGHEPGPLRSEEVNLGGLPNLCSEDPSLIFPSLINFGKNRYIAPCDSVSVLSLVFLCSYR